jgi:hypothetical protein
MPTSIRSRLAVALAVVALGSTSAAAQDYMGPGSYYAPPPSYSGFGPPADLNISPPPPIPPPAPAYGYGPPIAYGYAPRRPYGYAPRGAYGYAPPAAYGYLPPPAANGYLGYGFVATPPSNPYYFGTQRWWREQERLAPR